jgi:glycosyltransferase involved in cell wall biosynthesis
VHKNKLLFFFPTPATFVSRDIALLQSQYHVVPFAFNPRYKAFLPISFIKQFFFLLVHLPSSAIVVGQLAAYHSFLPVIMAKLFRKPSVIFLAGTDCAYFPSIQYGNFCKPLLGWFTSASVRMATHLAPKHESLIHFDYTYDASGAPVQGIRHFVKNLTTPYTVIPNGFDSTVFFPLDVARKPCSFITVAVGIGTANINTLKGIDLILETSRIFPDCTFTLVGVAAAVLKDIPANVHCLPLQNTQQLQQLYSGHQFYLQLSLSEGFPNAVCEAMLCGCVPIVSDVNALPDIAAGCGFVVKQRNKEMLKAAIEKALEMSTTAMAQKAVEHIRKEYTMQKRKEQLYELFDYLLKSNTNGL